MRYYLRVRYYFILTCHYGLLHNNIAYKQLQYIATYFSSKDFVLTRQLQFKHARLEGYTVSLLNNIWNFDRHLISPGLFLTYIEMDMNISGVGALVISVYKKYGPVLFEGAVQLTLFPETRIKPFK